MVGKRIDLVSVVAHELGHIAGLDHDDHAGDVMGDSLTAATRRVPTAADVKEVVPAIGARHRSAPIIGEVITVFSSEGISSENVIQATAVPGGTRLTRLFQNGTCTIGDRLFARYGGTVWKPGHLLAAAVGGGAGEAVTQKQVQPLLAEAVARWAATGVDAGSLNGVDVHITDLPGAQLGMVSGHTIWLDRDAAGWGWFYDPTPGDDTEFRTPGDQGEQNRMDLLSVIEHEMGNILVFEHDDHGVMSETLAAGTRLAPGSDADTVFAQLAADDETAWIGRSLFARGKQKR